VLDTTQLVRKQEKLIRELKQELLMHNALAEKTGTDQSPSPFLTTCRAPPVAIIPLLTTTHHHSPCPRSLGPADQVVYDPYTPEQRAEVRRLCERYLRASADEEDDMLVFQSVRQMREMCRQFKSLVADLLAAQANNAMNHGTTTNAPFF
jgi:hypothetical protein